MISWSGPGLTLLMLLLLPVFWAMPMALVCSELGSALPEEGGYYAWTRRALGEFWGFQCGWWSWTCQWVDSAVYIALIQVYVHGWWPQLNGWEIWGIGAVLIALFAYTNIRGLNIIALSSVLFTIIIVAPFLVMIVLGFAHWHGGPFQPVRAPRPVDLQQPEPRARRGRLDVLGLRLDVDHRRRDGAARAASSRGRS